MNIRLIWAIGAAALAVCGVAFAQSARGTILGLAQDPSGAVMANVSIRVTNEQTNQSVDVKTDTMGNYTVPLLRPGQYSVTAETAGFRRFVRSGIVLQVDQTARIDIAMQVGDVSQAVEEIGRASCRERV